MSRPDDDLTPEERLQVEIEGEELRGGRPGEPAGEPADEQPEVPVPVLALHHAYMGGTSDVAKRDVLVIAKQIARLELEAWARQVRDAADEVTP